MARRRNRTVTASPPRRVSAPRHYVDRKPVWRTVYHYVPSAPLLDFEDRRTWHPDKPHNPVFSFNRDARRIVEKPRRTKAAGFMDSLRLGFKDPHSVVKCIRRKERRETIFALKKQGKGSRAPRRRRDDFSDLSCRRT